MVPFSFLLFGTFIQTVQYIYNNFIDIFTFFVLPFYQSGGLMSAESHNPLTLNFCKYMMTSFVMIYFQWFFIILGRSRLRRSGFNGLKKASKEGVAEEAPKKDFVETEVAMTEALVLTQTLWRAVLRTGSLRNWLIYYKTKRRPIANNFQNHAI